MFDLIWEMSAESAAQRKMFWREATASSEKWLKTANLASFMNKKQSVVPTKTTEMP